jgi:hypothetical protein
MARSSEKAQAVLNRWQAMKMEERLGYSVHRKRPKSTAEVNSPTEAQRWRNQIIKEISRKFSSIQNGTFV